MGFTCKAVLGTGEWQKCSFSSVRKVDWGKYMYKDIVRVYFAITET